MDTDAYHDRVHGGWLGKFIGGTLGGPVEGRKELFDFWYYPELPTAAAENDDTDIQLVWLHALQERGVHLNRYDLMDEWLQHVVYPWNEYGYGRQNWTREILPPVSGWFNNPWTTGMGAPIRSEIWAFICPGNPTQAVEYAWNDGCLDHADDGLWGEMFLAAIEAAAFAESDGERLLDLGLSVIPEACDLARAVRHVREGHRAIRDWKDARARLLADFDHPDMTNVPLNLGIITLGLLYGDWDFERSLCIAVNCGYDTDCTGATTGAIIGALKGADAIPPRWKDPLQDTFKPGWGVINLARDNTLTALTGETVAVGQQVRTAKPGPWDGSVDTRRMSEVRDRSSKLLYFDRGPLRLTVDYLGAPTVGIGAPKQFDLTVHNAGEQALEVETDLEGPYYLTLFPEEGSLRLRPGDTSTIHYELAGSEVAPTNRVTVSLSADDAPVEPIPVTFAGEWQWGVCGPFSAAADDLLEEPMSPEHDWDEVWWRWQSSPTEWLDFEQFLGEQEGVFYLWTIVESPDPRPALLRLGSSGPVKVWLNDTVIHTSHARRPVVNVSIDHVKAELSEGRNELHVKLVREHPEGFFSLRIMDEKQFAYTDLVTCRELPWGVVSRLDEDTEDWDELGGDWNGDEDAEADDD